jgi:MFS family permease
VGFAAAVFLLPLSYGPLPFAILFGVLGVCRGLLRATSGALLVEDSGGARGRRLGVASGVYNSAMDIGSIAGPAISGFVAAAFGIPAMLQIVSATWRGWPGIAALALRRFLGGPTTESDLEEVGASPASVAERGGR